MLAGSCATLKVQYWKYEVCLGGRVRQYHEADGKGGWDEHVLGKADPAASIANGQVYAGGETCAAAAA